MKISALPADATVSAPVNFSGETEIAASRDSHIAPKSNTETTDTDSNGNDKGDNEDSNNVNKKKKKQQRGRLQWREAVAGACAGAASRTILAPVERVKLILQLRGESLSAETTTGASAQRPPPPLHQQQHPRLSAWAVAKLVYREQGVLAFWRGNLSNVYRVSGSAAINFTALDYFKNVVTSDYCTKLLQLIEHRQRHWWISLLSGGLAGATSATLLYPIEFARTRLAMDMGRSPQDRYYTGTVDVFRKTFQTDGVAGFFKGYGISLVGGVVYRLLYLGGYDALKEEILYRKERKKLPRQLTWGERFVGAQAISLTAGTISYPFDTVRRRLMMQSGKLLSERLYHNSFQCIATIWRKEGLRGFYLGLGPNIFRSLGGAIMLVGYDTIRPILK